MIRLLILILCANSLSSPSQAQDRTALRQGGYFKPAAALLELERITSKVPDLAAWTKRRASVRAG